MNADDILIIGLLSHESPRYWDLCYKCIKATADSTNIRYFIGLDRVKKSRVAELTSYIPSLIVEDISIPLKLKKKRRYDEPFVFTEETTHQKRIRIGQLYNNLFSAFPKDYKFIFSLDGDIALTYKGWDSLFKNELTNECVVIGHEYSKRWPEKYQNFPCLQCSFFEWDKVKHIKFDFRGDGSPMLIETKEQSDIFELPVGSKLNRDIGWRWPLDLKLNGLTGKCLKFLPGDSPECKIINPINEFDKKMYKMNDRDKIKGLFEMHWNNEAIGTHLTKSTCLEFNEHPISKYWIEKVKKTVGIS